MNRADMIEAAARALCEADGADWTACNFPHLHRKDASAVLDAVLPQVSTVEQLDWYGDGAQLMPDDGQQLLTLSSPYLTAGGLGLIPIEDALDRFGPLTVVWQPSEVTVQ